MTQLDDQGLPVCTGLSMRGAPESIPAVGHNSDVTHEAELRTLIGEISRAHMKAHLSAAQVHDAMLEAGRKLIRLRAICSDLEWRSLKTIVGSERTTRRYMALARECAVSSDPHKMHQRLLDSLPIPSDDDVPKEGGHLSAPVGQSSSRLRPSALR